MQVDLGAIAYSMKHIIVQHEECICNKFVTNALFISYDLLFM